MKYSLLLTLISISLLCACTHKDRLFKERDSDKSGIYFQNELTESDDFNILDYLYFYNGGGTAVGDINNDGLPDIFLAGNQVGNKLYLNKGNLQFEDITDAAGILKNSDWNTGAIMGDVNQDGLLDIYVCAVVGIKGLTGYNELYINNGDLTFTEQAADYHLDYTSYSSSAAFLDFDQDGDLDIYLLNHAIHTPASFGEASLRYERSYETGDKLLRNDSLFFTDVSEEAGILGGINGYGLGVAISDFNNDSYPDIYVGNDFHEDDYYYLNNGDGTFTESLRKYFGYTSRFSMGSDVADINNDGYMDIMSLDMLPEDPAILKRSEGDENYNIMRLKNEAYGYYYQFSRNMLFLGQSSGGFLETAHLSGIQATDWSWSALFADFDLDGYQDLFISNGIPKRPNDIDYIKFVSDDRIKNTIDQTKIVDQEALNLMPDGQVKNYFFKGEGLRFTDYSDVWLKNKPSYATSSALADLDNDGDLDIITNNVNAPATLLVNNAKSNFLKIQLQYDSANIFGVGTKIRLYQNGNIQLRELYTARGFQASSEPLVYFGLGEEGIDSLEVTWPDGSVQWIKQIQVNQTIIIAKNATSYGTTPTKKHEIVFKKVPLIDHIHQEDRYVHFDRQRLLPFQASDRGPAVATGDINGDSLQDVFFGGSKYHPATIYFQTEEGFEKSSLALDGALSINENVDARISDFDEDGKPDIMIANGGSDFFGKASPLTSTLLLQTDTGFYEADFPDTHENSSVILPIDIDMDGDLDVFIGSHSITGDYGNVPASYVLENVNGKFSLIAKWKLGMINDAISTDFDADGDMDIIAVGEWAAPIFLENKDGKLEIADTQLATIGLWFAIHPFDIDGDGDEDYMLGNWGLNSKFTATVQTPLRMYYHDFDENGTTETIVATHHEGSYYPIESFDELAAQIVSLKKKYPSYASFSGQDVGQILGESLKKSKMLEVNELSSGYLLNEGGTFRFIPFPPLFQVAPITTFLDMDINGDKKRELIAAGNYFGIKPHMGKMGAFPGGIVWNENHFELTNHLGLNLMNKQVKKLSILNVKGEDHLMATIHNDSVQVFQIRRNE